MSTAAAMSEQSEKQGVACPTCGCRHLDVLYTRLGYRSRQRVRLCRHCGRRILTKEKIVGEADEERRG